MTLHRRKTLKKIVATVSIIFLTVLFCISPCAVSRVHAAGSSDISAQAVLSKSHFGTVKKVDNVYYIVDEFGNIIDTINPIAGNDLDRYIGRQILVKDNLFAGLLESRQERRDTFFTRLREYLSGIVPKPKLVTPKPIDPIVKPDPIEDPVIRPLYGVYPDPVVIEPIKKPDPIEDPVIRPLYGVYPDPVVIEPIKKPDPIEDPVIRPLYGVYPDPVVIEPIVKPEPIEPGSVIDKIVTIEKQISDGKELDSQGIKIVPEIKGEQKPFQDGSGKE